jgi:hypothetical protein
LASDRGTAARIVIRPMLPRQISQCQPRLASAASASKTERSVRRQGSESIACCQSHGRLSRLPPTAKRACLAVCDRIYTVNNPICRFGGLTPAFGPRWAAALPIVIPTTGVCPGGLAYAYNGLGRGPTRPSNLGDDKCCRGPACGQALGSKLIDALDVTIAARPRPWGAAHSSASSPSRTISSPR